MNLFFAIVVFALIAFIGEKKTEPIVGDVAVGSAAYQAGFRSHDRILKIGDKGIAFWSDVRDTINNLKSKNVEFVVERQGEPQNLKFTATTSLEKNPNILSLKDQVPWIKGLSPLSKAALVGVSQPDSWAYKLGLKTGDEILEINGEPTPYWRNLSHKLISSLGKDVEVKVRRRKSLSNLEEAEELTLSGRLPTLKLAPMQAYITGDLPENFQASPTEVLENTAPKTTVNAMEMLGLHLPDTFIAEVSPDSPAEKAGLKFGDKIIAINKKPVLEFDHIVEQVGEFKNTDPPLAVEFQRDGQVVTANMTPVLAEPDKNFGNYDSRYIIGIRPLKAIGAEHSFIWRTNSPVEILANGVEKSWLWTKLTLVSFVKLILNEVSPKNLGGFISIGQMAQKSWQVGISPYLRVMAIISINLFIINLFPIPLLDGGHLLFFTVEALRGTPLSMRKMEVAQQVGLVFLLGLMGYALFNDFSRVFGF